MIARPDFLTGVSKYWIEYVILIVINDREGTKTEYWTGGHGEGNSQ